MKREEKIISLNGREIRYHIRQNRRARHLLITVCDGDSFVVTKPVYVSFMVTEQFILAQQNWIELTLKKYQRSGTQFFQGTRKDYLNNKKTAEQLVTQKLEQFNQFYGFKYAKVTVRDQRTRWGSCSRNGNLNFNYKILFLPEAMASYLIVHELCHLKEMNHSARFWLLVAKTMPNYLETRKALRRYPVKIL